METANTEMRLSDIERAKIERRAQPDFQPVRDLLEDARGKFQQLHNETPQQLDYQFGLVEALTRLGDLDLKAQDASAAERDYGQMHRVQSVPHSSPCRISRWPRIARGR